MSKINVSFSYTINIGNYESIKFQAGIEKDVIKNEYEEIEQEFKKIETLVMEKVNIKKELKKSKRLNPNNYL